MEQDRHPGRSHHPVSYTHLDVYKRQEVPTALHGVDGGILDPRDTYTDSAQWEEKARNLSAQFEENYKKYR